MSLHEKLLNLLFDDSMLRIQEHDRIFNPLTVLKIQRYEIRHVNTLSWLLDPNESHNLGDAFLKRFMQVVATVGSGAERTAVLSQFALTSDTSVRVRREVQTADLRKLQESEINDALSGRLTADERGADPGMSPDGALDLLVEGDGWVVALEAKVESGLHSDQLSTYRRALDQGAPKAQRIFVFLNQDAESPPDDAHWTHVTWQAAVIAPLRAILDKPAAASNDYALKFIASYLEVLEYQCAEPGSYRESLFSELLEKHDAVLASICGRSADGLEPSVKALVLANLQMFRDLSRRYQSPAQRRLKTLHAFVDQMPGIVRVHSSVGAVRFVSTTWLDYPWVNDKVRTYPGVVCELLNNRDLGVRFKLMIRDLGEAEYNDTPYFAQRTRLCRAAQTHPQAAELFRAALLANGTPRNLEPTFPAVTLTAWQSGEAVQTIEGLRRAYAAFDPSVVAITALMATIR
jgi:hypothetical protein